VSRAIVRETFELRGGSWEQVGYRYELVDREADGRLGPL